MQEKEAIEEFMKTVKWVHEFEYGDFKRKLGLYVNRLGERLGKKDQLTKNILAEMRQVIVFDPDGDIEATRSRAIRLAEKLLKNYTSH